MDRSWYFKTVKNHRDNLVQSFYLMNDETDVKRGQMIGCEVTYLFNL